MDITTAHILDSLGWAVMHSLWQGALAAIAVYFFRAFTKDSQAGLRCGFELVALGLCFTAFIGTFVLKFSAAVSTAPLITTLNEIVIPAVSDSAVNGTAGTLSALSGTSFTHYTPLLGLLWCLGFLLLATRYSVGFAMTHRLRTRGLSPVPKGWKSRFETLVLNSGIFRTVTLHISDRVSGPVTLGFFKPVVLVPASFFSGLPADQIEAILLHEIAHIRRHDYLINLFQTAIKTILFFHPAVHYICRTIDEDREKACDDFAVNYTQNPTALAKGLATLRMGLLPPGFAPDFSLAASKKRNPLLRRLTRLTAPEESRRRRLDRNWGQVATTLTAMVVAAGIYTGTSVEFANAHPPETNDLVIKEAMVDDTLHVSADKKNYHFSTIRHDGRTITIKSAQDGSRWVYFDNSWFNIDSNPKILDAVPSVPKAPKMPKPEGFNGKMKFDKAVKQYRVSLDYYIAALENCGCKKTKLHWAKKQKSRVSEPMPDFDKDFLWKEASLSSTPKPKPVPRPAAKPIVNLAPNPVEIPEPPVKPVVQSAELEPGLYIDGKKVHLEDWAEDTEDRIERLADKFENKMERVEDEFEVALEKFEHATEKFARNPESKKAYFEQAQKDFADAVVAANKKRTDLSDDFDKNVEKLVEKQMQKKAGFTSPQKEMALEKARIDSEKARKEAAKARKHAEASWNVENHVPVSDSYKDVMLAQLGNDGVIPHGSSSALVEYREGDMYVNGQQLEDRTAEGYCSINKAFDIPKSDNMRIEIKSERLTITNYSN